jgi:trehalose 6-phosphate phosphatase
MNYLFLQNSLKKIRKHLSVNTLYAFDFDGTLSKISPKIEDANLQVSTYKLLFILSQHVPVAIISGRSIDDLKNRIKVSNIDLVGNHGLEGISKWKNTQLNAKNICKEWLHFLKNQNLEKNIFIEDKNYSISIHFRDSKNRQASAKIIESIICKLSPAPRIIGGKCVYNLVPKDSPNKGTAILALKKIKKTKNVFYIGDDDTDEDVFKLPQKAIITARIGKKKKSKAIYYLKKQSEINKLLKFLILNIKK